MAVEFDEQKLYQVSAPAQGSTFARWLSKASGGSVDQKAAEQLLIVLSLLVLIASGVIAWYKVEHLPQDRYINYNGTEPF